MAKPGDFDFYCEEALTGKTKLDILYDSETVMAFNHTKPSFETHIMIIPKKHIHDLTRLTPKDNQLMIEIINVAKDLASELGLDKKGARLVTNMGKYQETPHLHFHLISGGNIK